MTRALDLPPADLIGLAAPSTDVTTSLADLALEVPVLPATTTCEALDRVFARDHDLLCVLVPHPDDRDLLGLVQRQRFETLMTGPFGYGRSLHGRRPLAETAQWDALTLQPRVGIVEAASRAVTRDAEHVHDPVIVQGPGHPRVLPVPVLLSALARTLAARALTDPLTGLANREMFFGRVEEACRRSATRPGHLTAVVYLDLDTFKAVNDHLGHEGGDDLLRDCGRRLVAAARGQDLVARLGGDEFAVCLEVDGADGVLDVEAHAAALATRLHTALSIPASDGGTAVRVSGGVAICGTGTVDAAELVRAADLAMYTAKRAGGDRVADVVVVHSSAHADPLVGTSVAEAAARGEFLLEYQPIVDLATGRPVSVEALIRWQHPRLGRLAPDAFLPAIERAGELPVLDSWVLTTACRQFAGFLADGAPAGLRYVNVNVTADWLLTETAVEVAEDAARAAGLPPTGVRIEVSETLLADQLALVRPTLRRLADVGFGITFDDVGAGSVSLRHLREIRADGLKIDRSYVQGMTTGDRDRSVVQLLIDFGGGTGTRVTAEGVETEGQRAQLLAAGCAFGQGWLFGRPGPLTALAVADRQPVTDSSALH